MVLVLVGGVVGHGEGAPPLSTRTGGVQSAVERVRGTIGKAGAPESNPNNISSCSVHSTVRTPSIFTSGHCCACTYT